MINNNLEHEWNQANDKGLSDPSRSPSSIDRKHLNVPFTDVTSPVGEDGFPFISHSPDHTARFLGSEKTRSNYFKRLDELTSSWGPSTPLKLDFDRLKEVTSQLIKATILGDVPRVQRALLEGADPDTLVLVRDVCAKNPSYLVAPLGVACAMLHAQDRQPMLQDAYKAITRLLLVREGKSVVDVGPSPEHQSMSAGFSLPSIEWGGNLEYRQVPLTFAQSGVLSKFVPESMDRPVKNVSAGVAYGEELPTEMKDTFLDLYDPARDTLTSAIDRYRTAKPQNPSSASAPKMK